MQLYKNEIEYMIHDDYKMYYTCGLTSHSLNSSEKHKSRRTHSTHRAELTRNDKPTSAHLNRNPILPYIDFSIFRVIYISSE